MFARILFLIALALLLTMVGTALAQEPVGPYHADPSWRASYWNNLSLSGTPALERSEVTLNHDWGAGSPNAIVRADSFSARWTRYLLLSEGTYRFTATSDDGIRVWVDGELIIEEWNDHPAKTVSAEKSLSGGHVWVVVEYYEHQGLATARLTWEPLTVSGKEWRGEYFDNVTLSGTPVLVRGDAQIDFDWGIASPSPGTLGADRFSVRWTRTLRLAAGRYRFKMTVDDGGRLWVNNHLLLESWKDQPATTYTDEIYLPGGDVPVTMEYYEDGGQAVARLAWELATTTPTTHGWRGDYFNRLSFTGTPALARDDAKIDFDWGTGSPASGLVQADGFAVRWKSTLDLVAGRYRFLMTVDDGGRLWVDGHLLIDVWHDQAAQTYSGEIELSGDPVPVVMEYYERAGLAVARLSWSRIDGESAPGTVVVDDADPGFVKGGSSTGWHSAAEGYGGRLTWTRNNDWQRENYNWARWYPDLEPGRYQVFVYIPDRYTTTAGARYVISHAGTYTSRVVDQSIDGDRWISLGSYWFDGDGDEYVLLSDVTYETRLSRLIAFDAAKWVPD